MVVKSVEIERPIRLSSNGKSAESAVWADASQKIWKELAADPVANATRGFPQKN
jgi:hypothetical protein